jgi:hypothetical protein
VNDKQNLVGLGTIPEAMENKASAKTKKRQKSQADIA